MVNSLTKFTPRRRQKFLDELAKGQSVNLAAKAAGMDRRHMYKIRAGDPQFAEDWADAIEQGADRLEDVATERAIKGSDKLLLALLRAKRPQVYRETIRQEISGPEGAPVAMRNEVDLSKLTDEELKVLEGISRKLQGPGDAGDASG